MYKALYLSPMIPSFDIGQTTGFFKYLLDFGVVMDTDNYAILQKNGLTIHLLRAGENIGQMEFYLEVDNVDHIWNSIKDKVTAIKTRPPFDRDYGMREMHIAVPYTNTLMFIGHEMKV